jgi:hypothetical protein
MQDGRVWKGIKDAHGDSFFFGPGTEEEAKKKKCSEVETTLSM